MLSQQKNRIVRSTLWIALGAPLFSSVVACSHFGHKSDSNGSVAGASSVIVNPVEKEIIKDAPPTMNDLSDSGADLLGIPTDVNKAVFQWIDYFQGRGRPHMERYLQRASRYMPLMKKILRENGLPEDLIYIALIESGFSSTAHSSANAVGYWQFIRGTGKMYNLQIDSYVDERRDFVKSTQAAAEYYKTLYNLFGSWYLAIASYNVGENRVKNIVVKYRTRDFWQMARENKLPEETINYVPKFLAARLIAKEPEKYGFTDLEYMPALDFDTVNFETSVDIRKLAKELNLEYDDLRDLNPSYKRGVAFMKNGKLELRVPRGMQAQALAAAPLASAEAPRVYVADEDYSYYRVRRGDTIASIAKKFGSSQRQIRTMNRLRSGTRLVAGRRLRVPGESVGGLAREQSAGKPGLSAKPTQLADKDSAVKTGRDKVAAMLRKPSGAVKTARAAAKQVRRVHVVRKGENLIQIARKYGVSIRELTSANGIRQRAKISIGARLQIP